MLKHFISYLALGVLAGCASSGSNVRYTWVNEDPSRAGQSALNRDWFDCSNYADYKTAGQSEAAARASGDAARLGGGSAGFLQMMSGLLLVDSSKDQHREACMQSRGWTKKLMSTPTPPNASLKSPGALLQNGNRWTGAMTDGKPSGYGTLIYSDSATTYTGNMLGGIPNGYGEMLFRNGEKYSGYYKNGIFNGSGTFTNSKGTH